jgi:ribonuclease D
VGGDPVIVDPSEVEALAARAAAAGRVALDTEFFWERTYAPQLCLVQVGVEDEVALVDPLEGAPLEPIAELLADPNVEVVMHAPSGDLLAFGLRYGVRPTRVLDTQLLAGFVGLTASASLDRLVDAVLKTQLHHDESFSDWRRRPLTDVQQRYAGDDVRYLLPLVDRLFERLDQKGRRAWADAETSRRYADGEDVVPDPQRAWRKVQRRGKLAPRQLAVLRAVSAWREETARRRDIPASWLVKDPTLIELARLSPRSEDDARRVRGIGKSLPAADVQTLLAAVGQGLEADLPAAEPAPAPAVTRRVDAAVGLAGALHRVRSMDAGIAPELVATRAELERFLEAVVSDAGEEEHPLGQGWRRELVGDELIELVQGRVGLALRDRPPYLAITPLPDVPDPASAD